MKLVSEAKLEGIEWGGDVHVPHGNLSRAREVRRLTEDAGLEVSAYGSYYRFDDCLSHSRESEPSWNAVLDTANELGAPWIRVWAGRLGSEATSDAMRQAIVERCLYVSDQAMHRGIKVGFEFHDSTLTDSNEATAKLLEAVGHPNLFTFWQPYLCVEQAYRLEGLKRLLDKIGNVHCNHFSKAGWPHSLLLEEGEADWGEFLEVLRSDGTDRWISIEHVRDHSVENFYRDAETLRRWIHG